LVIILLALSPNCELFNYFFFLDLIVESTKYLFSILKATTSGVLLRNNPEPTSDFQFHARYSSLFHRHFWNGARDEEWIRKSAGNLL